jgi:hypothetical protein
MDSGPPMPTLMHYRGVAIHRFQSLERIELAVKPAIDAVLKLRDQPELLLEYAGDRTRPPEARLLCRDLFEAMHQLRAAEHVQRVDRLPLMLAMTAGLRVLRCADPCRYASIWDPQPAPGAPRAAQRSDRHREDLEAAQAAVWR